MKRFTSFPYSFSLLFPFCFRFSLALSLFHFLLSFLSSHFSLVSSIFAFFSPIFLFFVLLPSFTSLLFSPFFSAFLCVACLCRKSLIHVASHESSSSVFDLSRHIFPAILSHQSVMHIMCHDSLSHVFDLSPCRTFASFKPLPCFFARPGLPSSCCHVLRC